MLEYIPKNGIIGRLLNPHPFNHKEHAAILIMSSTAARSAMAAEVIAVQRLWYSSTPNAAVCIFLIFSSQILGYGIAGLLRKILVYPTKVSRHICYSSGIAEASESSSSILQIYQSCRCWNPSTERSWTRNHNLRCSIWPSS